MECGVDGDQQLPCKNCCSGKIIAAGVVENTITGLFIFEAENSTIGRLFFDFGQMAVFTAPMDRIETDTRPERPFRTTF